MELQELNLPDSVLDSLYAITHFENERNVQYWKRILQDPSGNAKVVKLADIRDNTSDFRMRGLLEEDQIRLRKKYEQALHVLNGGN